MRVRSRQVDIERVPRNERFYYSQSQVFLRPQRDYTVYAVSVYDGVVFLLVVDDKETPMFLPRFLFETSSSVMPDDWICSVFIEGAVQCVVGPEFLACNAAAYNAMIDQERRQVDRFWERIERGEVESPWSESDQ